MGGVLFRFAVKAQSLLRSAAMRCFGVLPVQGKKVVFTSFSGKAYSDNPRAISEAVRDACPGADIVWMFKEPEGKAPVTPEYVRRVKIHSLGALYELATAKVWVDNMPKPLYTRKRKGQFYIQTWHGDRGFKKMLYDAPDHPAGKPILEQDICDVMTSGSEFCEGTYHTGFHYHGEILKDGSPRNDVLVSLPTEKAAAVKRALGIDKSAKVLLYAPTMRNASRRKHELQPIQPIDLLRTLNALEKKFGGQFVCVVRCHATSLGLSGLPESERIIDASGYEDMADLLLVTDVLITDYSSSAGDFALTGRPIVLFQEDREGFAREERTFYFDIEASPFHVVEGQAALEAHIEGLTDESIQSNDQAILKFYGVYETGHASKAVAERIHQVQVKN